MVGICASKKWRIGACLLIIASLPMISGCRSTLLATKGQELAAVGQYQEALDQMLPTLALQSDDPASNLEVGICYLQIGQYEEAFALLEKALRARPSDRAAMYFYAVAREAVRGYEAAAPLYHRYAAIADYGQARDQVAARATLMDRLSAQNWARTALEPSDAEAGVNISQGSVAVGAFRVTGDDPEIRVLGKGLSYLIRRDLGLLVDLNVLDRKRVMALTEILEFGTGGAVPAVQSDSVRQLLAVEHFVGGTITALGPNSMRVDPEVTGVDGATRALQDYSISGKDFFRIKTEIVLAYLQALNVPVTDDVRQLVQGAPTQSFTAFRLFAEGLDREDHGLYPEAEMAYKAANKRDKTFYLARLKAGEMHEIAQMGSERLVTLGAPNAQVLSEEKVFPALPDADLLDRLQTAGVLAGSGMVPGNDARQPVEEERQSQAMHEAARNRVPSKPPGGGGGGGGGGN
jgi:tetratricopeptide (TPR) repeat protein